MGCPYEARAIVAAGIVDEADDIAAVDFGSKRHLETEDDDLVLLADVIPVASLREVLSVGDLVLAAGVANVVFRLLRPRQAPVTTRLPRLGGGQASSTRPRHRRQRNLLFPLKRG